MFVPTDFANGFAVSGVHIRRTAPTATHQVSRFCHGDMSALQNPCRLHVWKGAGKERATYMCYMSGNVVIPGGTPTCSYTNEYFQSGWNSSPSGNLPYAREPGALSGSSKHEISREL